MARKVKKHFWDTAHFFGKQAVGVREILMIFNSSSD